MKLSAERMKIISDTINTESTDYQSEVSDANGSNTIGEDGVSVLIVSDIVGDVVCHVDNDGRIYYEDLDARRYVKGLINRK